MNFWFRANDISVAIHILTGCHSSLPSNFVKQLTDVWILSHIRYVFLKVSEEAADLHGL